MPRPMLFALSLSAILAACSTPAPGIVTENNPAHHKQDKQNHPLAGQGVAIPAPRAPGEVDLPRYPAISPDGQTLTFSWRGDLWRVPAIGGNAQRLTAHPANDTTSRWSPDATRIAFNSDRSGYGNVHIMDADGSNVQQITHEDHFLWLHDWSPAANGDRLTIAGYVEGDVHRAPRPYTVSINGGPIERIHDAYGRQSAISPDGKHVVFVRGGSSWNRPFIVNSDNRDLWLYDTQTQTFTQLTQNLGNDGKPKWIDNNTIAYLSARPPARINLYKLELGENEENAVALTSFDDNDVREFDVAGDGSTAVVQVWDTLYTLDLTQDDAQPTAVTITAPTDLDDTILVRQLNGESDEAALSPDGKVMATTIHGDLFIRTVDSENPPQRITHSAARETSPVWSPDGLSLYFVSDTDGTQSIYKANVTLTREEVEAVLVPAEVEAEKEKEDDTDSEEDAGDSDPGEGGFSPPDSDVETAQEGDASEDDTDESEDAEEEEEEEEGPGPDAWHSALRFEITPIIQTLHHDSGPSPSPDGRSLAFTRGNGDIMIHELAAGETRLFLASWDTGTHWTWSPDSTYLAISYEDQDHNADIWVGPVDASADLINITKHPAGDYMPSWSADGRILAFTSFRNDDQGDVYAVYLDKALETYTPQQYADYYEETSAAAKKLEPIAVVQFRQEDENDGNDEDDNNGEEEIEKVEPEFEIALDDAYLRLRRLTSSSSTAWNVRILPSGAQVAFTRGSNAYIVGWDGSDETKVTEGIDPQHLTRTGSAIVALRSGTPATVSIPGGKANNISFPGSIRTDRHADNHQRFVECARAISMQFYDPTYKGLDWENITAKYLGLASRAWTADEFNDIANQYLGLLDASHMGIRMPTPGNDVRQANGYLGARYERVDAGFEVVEIYNQSPAAQGVMRLQVGDIITQIGFEPLVPSDTINARLVGRVGRETAITILRSPEHLPQNNEVAAQENIEDGNEIIDADAPREVILLITPISSGRLDSIRYDNWQLGRKQLVEEWSDGRLGYIHIESMDGASLADFERDLYAACENKLGMIVDVRDNGGGWTTDRLLASIMTRRHAYTVPRGADPTLTNSYPNDRLFIARYNLPMNCLCNEKSFSNAEIFSHAFKTLERGTLVGNTTAGGVISTGSHRLLDGTSIRIPFRGWYLTDGTDMENHGAVPDLMVAQTPENEAQNEDPQLRAAVEDLLERLGE